MLRKGERSTSVEEKGLLRRGERFAGAKGKRFAYANVQRCLRQEKGFACANGEKICLRKW